LWKDRTDRQIVHILGRAQGDAVPSGYPSGPLLYRPVGFVDRMIEAYSVADVALCRGGATTLAELAAMGLPAIIVPYPYHRDRQQERQAKVFQEAGAAIVIDDAETTSERVAAEVDALLNDPARLERMSASARALGRPDAAAAVAAVVREVSR
jgi:UDP-N-acetylglucosamine--N-acetylmuramyl-(pentapeptide) pyrophosphoryl-undecaprenol N-acetylglucosamine transferase